MRRQVDRQDELLAEIGGQLQQLRWAAVRRNDVDSALNIAHAIDAVAWAAGIYSTNANVVDPPDEQATIVRSTVSVSQTMPERSDAIAAA